MLPPTSFKVGIFFLLVLRTKLTAIFVKASALMSENLIIRVGELKYMILYVCNINYQFIIDIMKSFLQGCISYVCVLKSIFK